MIDFALNNAWLIPFLPFLAFALIVLVFRPLPKVSAFVAITCMLISFILAVCIGIGVIQAGDKYLEHPLKAAVTWFSMKGLAIEVGTQIDPTVAMMLFVVTLVASLVQIYSIGYMHGDVGFGVFFAYLSLFAATMLGLVVAPNLLQMFVFWELVGLCSYLLIGFWWHKYSAREAAKKAFITCRTGDFGLLLGLILLQINFGTLDLQKLAEMIPNFAQYTHLSAGALTALAIVSFLGPIAKSGQFPLHVWLPDAMEGPTPVSALIHAATMVVAGVYLVGRVLVLFKTVTAAMTFVAFIGGFTALFAATIAITQVEMKKILAYSTVSQLGYMMLALGAGSLTASMFHLMTHAYFKALMFLGAGCVLHGMHNELNIWKYGGLKKYMPVTYWTFLIGCLAIAGIPPFAGFWSKDEILLVTYNMAAHGHQPLYYLLFGMAVLTAGLTAFYMFRMFFICFHGELRDKHAHPHEAPFSMLFALLVLAALSICGGLIGMPWLEKGFGYYVRYGHLHHEAPNYIIMIGSVVVACIGIFVAIKVYLQKSISHEAIAAKYKGIYTVLYNKYYVDEFYLWIIHNIIDGIGRVLWWVDLKIVDGVVDGVAGTTRGLGSIIRRVQTGQLQHYALVLFAGVVLLVIIMGLADSSSASSVIGGVR